jgi:hypothetical protein
MGHKKSEREKKAKLKGKPLRRMVQSVKRLIALVREMGCLVDYCAVEPILPSACLLACSRRESRE